MTEGFVNFELAKKLQEKGFDWQTFDWYDHLGNFNKGFIPRTLRGCPMHREYYAPTIGLAMKWLREVKKRHVTTGYNNVSKWRYIVIPLEADFEKEVNVWEKNFETYEQAVLAGITYCLDNLI